jgi:hypothetical protein
MDIKKLKEKNPVDKNSFPANNVLTPCIFVLKIV